MIINPERKKFFRENSVTEVSSDQLTAFASADIFVHPSHYDAFGITVLESFSQGCTAIATNKGGLPWVVDKAGLTFQDYNSQDLKEKLEFLIKNKTLRKDLSKKAKQRAEQFTWDKIILKLEKIYNDINNNNSV